MNFDRRSAMLVWGSVLALAFTTGVFGQTLIKLDATGPQPTVISPQGKVRPLYKASQALLISASNYLGTDKDGWRALPNTREEVDRLAVALRQHGFDVWRVFDPTGDEFSIVLRQFISKFGQDSENRLLVFFSGHGYTNPANDFGYLVPVDAIRPTVSLSDFMRSAMPIKTLQSMAEEITVRHAVFMFDSCFSGSIFMSRSQAQSLDPSPRAGDAEDRWRYFVGTSFQHIRQFVSAGTATEEVPAKSVFLPLLLKALEGRASTYRDGYVTGKEIGLWLEQQVPTYNPSQHPLSSPIRIPDLSFGDMVFQYGAPPPPTPAGLSKPPGGSVPNKVAYNIDVLFDVGTATLKPEAKVWLGDFTKKVAKVNLETMVVRGVADSSLGDDKHAQLLAMQRAENVKAYLVNGGVKASRIYTQATIDDGESAAQQAKNRRVQIEAIGGKFAVR